MTAPYLEFKQVTVAYGPVVALADVSFELKKGEILALLGSNGAGKTTTLRVLSGLIGAKRGAITFKNENLAPIPTHLRVKRRLSHVPEGRGIFLNLSVSENLDLGAWGQKNRQKVQADLERVLSLFPRLKERRQQNAGTLSGGEQQMLAIGRALMASPELLLLDEPSLGLAPQMIETIFATIKRINREGVSVLLVEQNAQKALSIAHQGVVLETGGVVMHGRAEELLASDTIRKAYLGG